jgi:hypothetical protein
MALDGIFEPPEPPPDADPAELVELQATAAVATSRTIPKAVTRVLRDELKAPP